MIVGIRIRELKPELAQEKFQCPVELVERIKAFQANARCASRSEAIRALITAGLAALKDITE